MFIQLIALLFISYLPSNDKKGLEIDGANENGTRKAYLSSGVITKYEWIIVRNGIVGLENEMFMDSTSLKTIELADSIQYIGIGCFMNCPIENILDNTFFGCSSLKTIEFPSSLKKIHGIHTFCLTTLLLYFISNGAIYKTADEGRILVENKTTALICAGGSQRITITPGITTIAQYFMDAFPIESINFEGSDLRIIQNSAFRGIQASQVDIPEGVTTLESSIFSESTKVRVVSIPSTITSIMPSTFASTSSIMKIIVHEKCSVLMVNEEGIVMDKNETLIYFFPKDIESFKITKKIKELNYGDLRNSRLFTKLETEENHSFYKAIDNVLY